ncbi:uncharacterized protein LOC122507344 [Leptopilina heterotoma]|uniref:uncharacterized protein LOC122507344 n=1 Tax=Leptopilina heterotoma TaxID=63436 RepID=UPI001CA8A89C|nr:uncharacterized protein LOC122507344 [Leptopilina heterotoma]
MTQLCKEFPVYIQSSKLFMIKRFRNNPKELTRRLLLQLVGKDELCNLTVLGKGKKKGISDDIREAVFLYITRKRTNKDEPFTVQQYHTAINNMCGTIRNPRSKTNNKRSRKTKTPEADSSTNEEDSDDQMERKKRNKRSRKTETPEADSSTNGEDSDEQMERKKQKKLI